MKHVIVYSKDIRNKLLDMGYVESKEPERNIRHSKFYVFFFEDTDEIRNLIDNEIERKKTRD